MIIALFVIFAIYKIMALCLLVSMSRELIKLWRRKAINDQAIQATALIVAINVFEWVGGWAQIEAAVVMIAIGIWYSMSLRKETKRHEANIKKIAEKAILTMMMEREVREQEIKAIEKSMEMEQRQR